MFDAFSIGEDHETFFNKYLSESFKRFFKMGGKMPIILYGSTGSGKFFYLFFLIYKILLGIVTAEK